MFKSFNLPLFLPRSRTTTKPTAWLQKKKKKDDSMDIQGSRSGEVIPAVASGASELPSSFALAGSGGGVRHGLIPELNLRGKFSLDR